MNEGKTTKSIYPWVVVGLLWVVALLNYMDKQMLSRMRVPMMGDISELESVANFGRLMAIVVLAILIIQICFLRPKTIDMKEDE